jgi:hypothetical protein
MSDWVVDTKGWNWTDELYSANTDVIAVHVNSGAAITEPDPLSAYIAGADADKIFPVYIASKV